MEALVAGVVFGLGLLLVFDALTRPEASLDIRRFAKRLGPRGAAGLGGATAGLLLTGWPVAAIAGASLGAAAPGLVERARTEREWVRRIEALTDLAARVRDALRAGIGIRDSLAQVASAPSPIGSELKRLAAETKVSGLGEAAATFGERMGKDGELVASALALSERVGARNTSEVLDALAEALEARAATIREAKAHQARARLSARIVAAVPLLLVLGIRHTNPAYLAPFDTVLGQVVLALALALIGAGYFTMVRIARVEGAWR